MASFEWIDADGRFRLALSPRPRPELVEDLARWRDTGVQRIISLQTEDESARMGLSSEQAAAEGLGLAFERFPIIDHTVPDDVDGAIEFSLKVLDHLSAGQGVVYHCYAGMGRSGLMAILTLMVAGYGYDDARRRTSVARGLAVPENTLQIAWLRAAAQRLGAGRV